MAKQGDGSHHSQHQQQKEDSSKSFLPPNFEPSDKDVIVGWARQNHQHVGNKTFRDLVQLYAPKYIRALTKSEKTEVIAEVIDKVRANSPGGGFVQRDFLTSRWYEIGNEKARDKVGHAIRKAAENLQERKKKRSRGVSEEQGEEEEDSSSESTSGGGTQHNHAAKSRVLLNKKPRAKPTRSYEKEQQSGDKRNKKVKRRRPMEKDEAGSQQTTMKRRDERSSSSSAVAVLVNDIESGGALDGVVNKDESYRMVRRSRISGVESRDHHSSATSSATSYFRDQEVTADASNGRGVWAAAPSSTSSTRRGATTNDGTILTGAGESDIPNRYDAFVSPTTSLMSSNEGALVHRNEQDPRLLLFSHLRVPPTNTPSLGLTAWTNRRTLSATTVPSFIRTASGASTSSGGIRERGIPSIIGGDFLSSQAVHPVLPSSYFRLQQQQMYAQEAACSYYFGGSSGALRYPSSPLLPLLYPHQFLIDSSSSLSGRVALGDTTTNTRDAGLPTSSSLLLGRSAVQRSGLPPLQQDEATNLLLLHNSTTQQTSNALFGATAADVLGGTTFYYSPSLTAPGHRRNALPAGSNCSLRDSTTLSPSAPRSMLASDNTALRLGHGANNNEAPRVSENAPSKNVVGSTSTSKKVRKSEKSATGMLGNSTTSKEEESKYLHGDNKRPP